MKFAPSVSDKWNAMATDYRRRCLEDRSVGPWPHLHPDEENLLLTMGEELCASGRYAIAWRIAQNNGRHHSRNMQPCFGALMHRPSNRIVYSGMLMFPGHAQSSIPWHEFIRKSRMYDLIDDDTVWIERNKIPTAFILRNLNYPTRYMVNYLISLRIPARNWPAVSAWQLLQERGASPMCAYILASFISWGHRINMFVLMCQQDEYPITGQAAIKNKLNLTRLITGRPLLNKEIAFTSNHTGIPNNTIWETHGRRTHWMPDAIRKKIGDHWGGVYFTEEEVKAMIELLDARLKETKEHEGS